MSDLAQQLADYQNTLQIFERLCLADPQLRQITTAQAKIKDSLLKLLSNAPFLANFFFRQPQILRQLLRQQKLNKQTFLKLLKEIRAIDLEQTEQQFMDQLRLKKQQALALIFLLDINLKRKIALTYSDLSRLADTIVQTALAKAELILKTEQPLPANCKLGIVALGKWGGRELNLSSDIDLLFIYPGEADLPPSKNFAPYPNREVYFSSLASKVIQLLNQITTEGLAYRVDSRLRPDGAVGALATSIDRYRSYAKEIARPWERACLIKARWIAGPLSLQRKYFYLIRPFIYRQYLDYTAISEISELRQNIYQLNTRREREEADIKEGPGGIREIELLTQSFQLIYGGRFSDLRTNNTVKAIENMARQQLISKKICRDLIADYYFLRTVEHGIMSVDQRQSHKLPAAGQQFENLARRCHLKKSSLLTKELEQRRKRVTSYFSQTLSADHEPLSVEEKEILKLLESKSAAKVKNRELALLLEHWQEFKPQTLLRKAGRRCQEIYNKLMPKLLIEINAYPQREQLLLKLFRLFSQAKARETLFTLLLWRPTVRNSLLQLMASSDLLSKVLISDPTLIDNLALQDSSSAEQLSNLTLTQFKELKQKRNAPEEQMNILRKIVDQETLIIALADLAGRLEVEQVLKRLSSLAEEAIETALDCVTQQIVATEKVRLRKKFANELLARFAVLAMGKLAAKQMGYYSDLDLIFIFDDSDKPLSSISAAEYKQLLKSLCKGEENLFSLYVRLAQRLITFLSGQTVGGKAYTIDLRLRPSGTQGPLVCTLNSFADYYQNRAALWEKYALLSSRAIAGHFLFSQKISERIKRLTEVKAKKEELRSELEKIRDQQLEKFSSNSDHCYDIKFARGGLFEIIFIIQYLQLRFGAKKTQIKTANSLQALQNLAECGFLTSEQAQQLKKSLLFYWSLGNWWRLNCDRSSSMIELTKEKAISAVKALKIPIAKGEDQLSLLEKEIKNNLKSVEKIYWKIVKEVN